MPFNCPLCRQNWIFTSKLCVDCEKIRHLIATYSLDTVNSVLEKVLVINQFKQEKILSNKIDITKEVNMGLDFKKNKDYKNTNT